MQISEDTLVGIENEIMAELEASVEFTMSSPYPDVSEIRKDVFDVEVSA
jgi:pyruvate dehydrogenase E1 component alpha subunit